MSLEVIKIRVRPSSFMHFFALAAVVAVLATLDVTGVATQFLFLGFCAVFALAVIAVVVDLMRAWTARKLTFSLYDRHLIWAVRLICGRRHTASALNMYARKLRLDGGLRESFLAHTKVLEFDPQPADYWVDCGLARFDLGKYFDSIKDFDVALKSMPAHECARIYRGLAWHHLGDYRAAIKDLAAIDCKSHTHVLVALVRGDLHERFHQWRLAIADYSLAADLAPEVTAAQSRLARLEAGCPDETFRNGEKAVDNAWSTCVRTNWTDWIEISVLASAFSETGDFDNARRFAQMAADLAPASERQGRMERLVQFQKNEPFRLPATDPRTGRILTECET